MVCQYLQDMASEEKLILLMVYDILVLQQRRVVAAYKQPRGDGECGGAEGSGCDAKVSQQSLHAGSSGASLSLRHLNFGMRCARLLWSLPFSTPNLQARGTISENRNQGVLNLSSPKHFSKTPYPHSPSCFLAVEPITTIKSCSWKRF